jgi:protein TonB
MHFTSSPQNKNMTGIALVVAIHAGALLFALAHSKILISTPVEAIPVDPIPPELKRPVELPKPFDLPKSDTTIVVPPMPFDVFTAPDRPVITTRLDTGDKQPPGGRSGGGDTGGGEGGGVTTHTPVTVPAVIDAGNCAKPDYPKSALRNGDAGKVTLAFLIGTDGRVASAKVEHSSGFRELDRAAVAGLSLCRFKPGTVDGTPFESWTRMQYVWSLDE